MRKSRSVLGLSVAIALAHAVSGTAHAQSACQQLISKVLARGNQATATIVLTQANRLSAYGAMDTLIPVGAYLTNAYGHPSDLLYSDRLTPGLKSQPFSVANGDPHDVWIALDGSSVHLRNRRFGNVAVVRAPVCAQDVLYGFGPPIGAYNGGQQALYVLSFSSATGTQD